MCVDVLEPILTLCVDVLEPILTLCVDALEPILTLCVDALEPMLTLCVDALEPILRGHHNLYFSMGSKGNDEFPLKIDSKNNSERTFKNTIEIKRKCLPNPNPTTYPEPTPR